MPWTTLANFIYPPVPLRPPLPPQKIFLNSAWMCKTYLPYAYEQNFNNYMYCTCLYLVVSKIICILCIKDIIIYIYFSVGTLVFHFCCTVYIDMITVHEALLALRYQCRWMNFKYHDHFQYLDCTSFYPEMYLKVNFFLYFSRETIENVFWLQIWYFRA